MKTKALHHKTQSSVGILYSTHCSSSGISDGDEAAVSVSEGQTWYAGVIKGRWYRTQTLNVLPPLTRACLWYIDIVSYSLGYVSFLTKISMFLQVIFYCKQCSLWQTSRETERTELLMFTNLCIYYVVQSEQNDSRKVWDWRLFSIIVAVKREWFRTFDGLKEHWWECDLNKIWTVYCLSVLKATMFTQNH